MESRIIDLETKSAYQERLIQELNDVLIAQQKQLDDLEKTVRHLEHFIRHAPTQGTTPEQEAPPPHY